MKKKISYWPHIDGLRAVAVTLVFLFHLNPNLLPQGYLGVDVFFVISGFVITQSLFVGYLRNGKVQLVDFYVRRFKRLYPVLITVILVTSLAYLFFGFQWYNNLFVTSAVTSVLAISNFYFIYRGDLYFEQDLVNPFTHTWSLGVEEQFYLLYPLLFAGLLLLVKKMKNQVLWLGFALFVLTAALYFIFVVSEGTVWSEYYWPTARFWELLAGCVLFFFYYGIDKISISVHLLSGLGVGILLSVLFPGLITSLQKTTLFTVLGSVFLIGGGLYGKSWVSTMLSNSRVVTAGKWSYSIYLWHLPVIYFLSLYCDTWLYLLLSPVLTILLSYLSYTYVEQRFRKSEFLTRVAPKIFKTGVVSAIFIILIVAHNGFGKSVSFFYQHMNDFSSKAKSINYLENKAGLGQRIQPDYYLNGKTVSGLCNGRNNTSLLSDVCWKKSENNRMLFLTGDSHATHFLSTLDESDIQADIYFESYPREEFVSSNVNSLHNQEFTNRRVDQLKALFENYSEIILLTSFYVTDEDDTVSIHNKIKEYVDIYSTYANIAFVLPTPVFGYGPVSCVATGVHCNFDYSYNQKQRSNLVTEVFSDILNDNNVNFYDPYNEICSSTDCLIYDSEKDFLLYRDDDHISVEASAALAPHFSKWFNNTTWLE